MVEVDKRIVLTDTNFVTISQSPLSFKRVILDVTSNVEHS